MKLNLGYLCVAILVYGPLMKGNGRVVRILLGFMASSSLSKRRSVLTHFFVWKREKEQIVNKQRKGQEGFLQTLSRRATSSNDDTQRRKKMAKLCCICVLREIRNAVEATSLWEIYIYIYIYRVWRACRNNWYDEFLISSIHVQVIWIERLFLNLFSSTEDGVVLNIDIYSWVKFVEDYYYCTGGI